MIRNLQPHSYDPSQEETLPLSSSGCVPCQNADPGYYNPNGQINHPLTMHALRQDSHNNRQSWKNQLKYQIYQIAILIPKPHTWGTRIL